MTPRTFPASPRIDIVVPCFNEAPMLELLHARLVATCASLPAQVRFLYVDDGSRDATLAGLQSLAQRDARVGVIALARNFGKEAAMTAGLDHCDGDAAVVIDADLQDPPELIATFLAKFVEGYDVVYGVRRSRAGESWVKRATAAAFYRVIGRLSRTPVPADTGDFRLMSARALAALRQVRERNRFMKGLFGWVGFRQLGVPYDRDARAAGETKWNYWRLWNFALEGITSFSTAPLRLATYAGVASALFAFFYAAWVIVKTLAFGDPVPGYPSLMVVILFLGGIQLIALGVIGEYLGRTYEESKQRPLYLLGEVHLPAHAGAADGASPGPTAAT